MPETLELQRRRRRAEMLKKIREQRSAHVGPLELRENDDGTVTLVGLACRTGVEYDLGWYREIILPEAFRRTLSEDPDVQLVVNHAAGGQLPLARTRSGTMRLALIEEGLSVEADLDDGDPDVQSLVRKMRRGDVDGMSFAFLVTDDSWNDDLTVRTIKSLSLHRGDVSVVNQGANPLAYATVRSQEAAAALHACTRTDVLDALYEIREGKTLSAATVDILTQVLSLSSDAEEASASARELLDGLINPDTNEAGDSVERSITNEADLRAAIRNVVRAPGRDEERARIIERANALSVPGLVPDCWAADGALADGRALTTQEQRETYNDLYTGLSLAVEDAVEGYWTWIVDFTDTEVIYSAGGDLYSCPYTIEPGGPITLGEPVNVRPVTTYVPTGPENEPEAEAVDAADEMLALPDYTTRARQELDLLTLRGRR